MVNSLLPNIVHNFIFNLAPSLNISGYNSVYTSKVAFAASFTKSTFVNLSYSFVRS